LINVELTNYARPMMIWFKRLSTSFASIPPGRKRVFSSFHPINLLKAKRLLPEVPVAILALAGGAGALVPLFIGRWISPVLVHPYFTDVNAGWIGQRQHALWAQSQCVDRE
jgi:glycerophosphoryl diester phosphodiesterase